MRASLGLGIIATIVLTAACGTHTVIESRGGGGDGTEPAASEAEDGTTTEADPTTPDPATVDPSNPEAPPGPVLPNIAITDVAVFQAVKVPLVAAGVAVKAATRKAPIVASRPGLIRVYVKPASGYKAQDVTAELRLVAADGTKFPLIKETKRITTTSTDEDLKSTFNLELPATSLPLGVTYQVSLTGSGGADPGKEPADGRFPRNGSFQNMEAELSGKLKVVLVPVKYDTDGSGRTPEVGAAQVEIYRKMMMSRYPASDVEITVRNPYSWTKTISRNGTGFDSVLSAMHQLRQADKVAKDVYYYGALAPSTSFSQFCQSGCVLGLSTVNENPNTSVTRASVGIGFAGKESANTMAHEVGHAHGREHAPCGGTSGADPDYPYTGGQIGVWGYDMFAKTFFSPTKGKDMMGYCPNEWVSDYTYNALFERIAAVNTAKMTTMAFNQNENESADQEDTSYRIAIVDGAGKLTWNDATTGDLDVHEKLSGGTIANAHFQSKTGAELAVRSAHFYRFDHLPGGLLYVPKESATQWSNVAIDGYNAKLAR